MCECPLALIGSIPCFISFRVFTQGKQFPHLLTHLKKKKKRKQLSSSIRTNLDIRAMTPSLSWAILSSCFSQTNHSLRDRLFIYIVVVISLSWMLYRNWKSLAWLAPDYLLFAFCDELPYHWAISLWDPSDVVASLDFWDCFSTKHFPLSVITRP